ncbi:MAG: xylulokinase [Clostridia bacterium]
MSQAGDLYLGIDVGTSGTKALLVTGDGRPVERATVEYPLHWPRPGWAEQDAEDWWRATVLATRRVLEKAGVSGDRVAAVGFSGQMHGSVFLDEKGQVIRPPILWCDVRTAAQCRTITEKVGGRERLIELTGNPALEGFTAPKVVWLMEEEPDAYERVRTILLPKDYVRYRLTGELATEVSDAAGTLLFDVAKGEWSAPVLEALGIDRSLLPPVLKSYEVAGRVTEEAARETGLKAGTPVVAGGADNTCGAVGAGIVREGVFLSSIGSSGVVLTPSDTLAKDPKGRVHSFNHSTENQWYLMGVTLAAGLSLKWFRDQLGQAERAVEAAGGPDAYDLLAAEAQKSEPGSRGLFFLPYLNGERTPHADANARAVFFGLSGAHTRADMVRAVFEGVTFSLRDSVEIMRELGREVTEIRAIGGGAKSPFWRQIQADVFGADVLTLEIDEGPAFGAALLAMVGAGRYKTVVEAADATVRTKDRTTPSGDRSRYEEAYAFYRSLYPAFKERYDALAKLNL